MKMTVEVDCTPLEARQFLGLPDVQPLQTVMLVEMEKNMLREAQRFSPKAIIQSWLVGSPPGADWLRALFNSALAQNTKPVEK